MRKELMTIADRHPADVRDVFAVDENVTRFLTQTGSLAFRTNGVTTIPAQEDPHMQLVFFRFQVVEEFSNRVHDERAFVGRQFAERHIHVNAAAARSLFEVGEVCAIARLCPRLNGALMQRFTLIRDNQIRIEVNGVTESLASRARAKGIVKGEKLRFWIFIPDAALFTLKGLRKAILSFARQGTVS